MFNPEKLLGGLLRGASSRSRGRSSGVGSVIKGGVGLGLLGIAIEAVDHYIKDSKTSQGNIPPPPPGPVPGPDSVYGTPLPPPDSSPVPPPPPGGTTTPPPPPSPSQGESVPEDSSDINEDAVLLIRAMISAANADGVIDEQEQNRIMGKLKSVELSDEEHTFLINELSSPKDMKSITDKVTSPEMARQVYAVSLMAIDIDNDAERTYMNNLSQRLGLDESTIDAIHLELGIEK
ncbi:MAG: tellurite resistance TerB family protein [Thermodesulfobacteriota bacterium]|nr:tellurite resistance TerB family protein [Thermodesulfobacteriota bacterium]